MDASIQTVLDLAACLGPQRDGSSEGLLPAPGAKRQFVRRRRPAQGLALLPADAPPPLNRPGRCGAATGRKAGPRGRSLPSAFSRRSVPARGGGRRASAEGGGRAPRPWVSGSRSGHSDWREVRGALWDGGRCSQGWGGRLREPRARSARPPCPAVVASSVSVGRRFQREQRVYGRREEKVLRG